MKVIDVNKDLNIAVAEVSGFKKEVKTDLLEKVEVGDYIIVHAGFAIQRLDEKEALETINLLKEMFSTELSY